jgi:hypothetical protein
MLCDEHTSLWKAPEGRAGCRTSPAWSPAVGGGRRLVYEDEPRRAVAR